MDTFYQRAYSLISSQKAREAFNIDAEPAKLRDEYGRNAAGQRMLMARRLVAAGVRFVSLDLRRLGHARRHRRRHAGPDARVRPGVRRPDPRPRPHAACSTGRWSWSRASSAARRRSTTTAGRDHWPKVFSVVLAGGGIKKGFIYGASNADGHASRRTTPIGPEDLATTVYHQLGIVADKELMAPGNRPDRDRRRRQGPQGTAGLSSARGSARWLDERTSPPWRCPDCSSTAIAAAIGCGLTRLQIGRLRTTADRPSHS